VLTGIQEADSLRSAEATETVTDAVSTAIGVFKAK
jgi:hypothetical protein